MQIVNFKLYIKHLASGSFYPDVPSANARHNTAESFFFCSICSENISLPQFFYYKFYQQLRSMRIFDLWDLLFPIATEIFLVCPNNRLEQPHTTFRIYEKV